MQSPGLSIGELSERTGIKPVTLRAWERRYGLLQPGRRDSGHRVYSETDLARVRAVVSWLERGVSIGQVTALMRGEGVSGGAQAPDQALLDAAVDGRVQQLDTLLGRRLAEQPLHLFVRDSLDPLRRQLGDVAGEGAALALFDGVLMHKLGALILKGARQVRRQPSWAVVVAGGVESEIQARLLALALLEGGTAALLVPRPVAAHALERLLAQQQAHKLLLVADPATSVTEWRRLTGPARTDERWLVVGTPPRGELPEGARSLEGTLVALLRQFAGGV